jgi:hypothetical protein
MAKRIAAAWASARGLPSHQIGLGQNKLQQWTFRRQRRNG